MRPCQSRAPINQYEHDQRNNDHHYSCQSEPPNSDAISPTARRSVAPTTWRNVARVVHLIPFIEPNRDITFYVRSGFGNTIASREVIRKVVAFCQSDASYAACSCRRGHRVKRPRCPVVALCGLSSMSDLSPARRPETVPAIGKSSGPPDVVCKGLVTASTAPRN